uniref:Uncharacterized protein LOC101501157 n=1 Tax=Cicer arietinum TaxID=3827 RepID=A0A1S2Z3Q3_CICAR|nr:uncharacterized protein LOC101501157 [Cicer arietinum]
MFLRVTPATGVGRVIKSKKLTPKFIGPYQILKRIDLVAYKVALPPILSLIHDVFRVSQLQKYVPNPSHVIESDEVQLKEDLSFEVLDIDWIERCRNDASKTINVKYEGRKEKKESRGLADFCRHYPSKFHGDVDPEKADKWLQEVEKIFEVI